MHGNIWKCSHLDSKYKFLIWLKLICFIFQSNRGCTWYLFLYYSCKMLCRDNKDTSWLYFIPILNTCTATFENFPTSIHNINFWFGLSWLVLSFRSAIEATRDIYFYIIYVWCSVKMKFLFILLLSHDPRPKLCRICWLTHYYHDYFCRSYLCFLK